MMKFIRPSRIPQTPYAAATVEPVTPDEARDHLRLTQHDQDEYLKTLIETARGYVESVTRRALVNQTWDVYFDDLGGPLLLPKPPVSAITSITYYDQNSVNQTLAATVYQLKDWNGMGYVGLAYDQQWPICRGHDQDVRVRFTAGYGAAAASVPAMLRHAIKLLIAHLYYNPEIIITGTIVAKVPMAIDHLLAQFVVGEVA